MSERCLRLIVSNDVNSLYECCVGRDVVFKSLYSTVLKTELGWKRGAPPLDDFGEFLKRFHRHGCSERGPWAERLRGLVKSYFFIQISSCLMRSGVRRKVVVDEFDYLYERNSSAIKLGILDEFPLEMASLILNFVPKV